MKHLYSKSLLFLFGLFFLSPSVLADQTGFTPAQTIQIQSIVRDYLVNNPQVLVEAARSLQQQQETAVQGQAKKAVIAHANELFHSPVSPVLGNPKGNVVMVEFLDYQCSYCKKMVGPLSQLVKDEPNVRFIVKELPIFGDNSQFAAQVALAAQNQGQYAALHKALLQSNTQLSSSIVLEAAKKAGINTDRLKQDMNNKAISQELDNNFTLANQLGIRGTPSFLLASDIDNPSRMKVVFIPGVATESSLRDVIKQLRK